MQAPTEPAGRKIGIMQPYFLPYLGYFQIMNACDEFVVYDNIQFTKKGWIHRNRMLLNGKDVMFSIPLKSDSDFLDINERYISDTFAKEKTKVLGQIKGAYAKAPHFREVYPIMEHIFNCPATNLFDFIFSSLGVVKEYLGIGTPLVLSSAIAANHSLKGKYRVMDIIKAQGCAAYINPIGGMELYDKAEFAANGIELRFHKMKAFTYPQPGPAFVPYLSVLDVMMHNSRDAIAGYLREFELL